MIEVGANVGYTLIAMAQSNSSLSYVVFEADDNVFELLRKNISSLEAVNEKVSVKAVQQFIGLEIDNVSLERYSGSNHAVLDGGNIRSKSLATIIRELKVDHSDLSLLVTDVDGFDWDVIRSAVELLKHKPYIYFECFSDNQSQLQNFKDLFRQLKALGYTNFVFFDNFGAHVSTLDALDQIDSLLDYVAAQNFYKLTRTIYYYDVLAFTTNKADEITKIIQDYSARHYTVE